MSYLTPPGILGFGTDKDVFFFDKPSILPLFDIDTIIISFFFLICGGGGALLTRLPLYWRLAKIRVQSRPMIL